MPTTANNPAMRIYPFQIKGSHENIYQTRLMEDGNHFYHTCTCPSSHNKKCKHIYQLLAGDISSVVDLDKVTYHHAIEAISSFKRGMHAINKARVKKRLSPLCRVCKCEMKVIHQSVSWWVKLFDSKSSSRRKYICPNCKEQT